MGFAPLNPSYKLFRGGRDRGLVGEGRHDLAGKAADVLARAAEIDDDVFDDAGTQRLQLAGDLVGRAEDRGVVAQPADLRLVMAGEALALVARLLGELVDPQMALEAPHIRRLQLLGSVGEIDRARDPDLHRVKAPPARFAVGFEL